MNMCKNFGDVLEMSCVLQKRLGMCDGMDGLDVMEAL